MSFAEWKKNNTVMDKCIPCGYQAMAYIVAQAAYKAGERQCRKDATAVAISAIRLRKLISHTPSCKSDTDQQPPASE